MTKDRTLLPVRRGATARESISVFYLHMLRSRVYGYGTPAGLREHDALMNEGSASHEETLSVT